MSIWVFSLWTGHGSMVCVALLAATASPAPFVTRSVCARYSCRWSLVQAPEAIAADNKSAATTGCTLSLLLIGSMLRPSLLARTEVENVPAARIGSRPLGSDLLPAAHEELHIVARNAPVERR